MALVEGKERVEGGPGKSEEEGVGWFWWEEMRGWRVVLVGEKERVEGGPGAREGEDGGWC